MLFINCELFEIFCTEEFETAGIERFELLTLETVVFDLLRLAIILFSFIAETFWAFKIYEPLLTLLRNAICELFKGR